MIRKVLVLLLSGFFSIVAGAQVAAVNLNAPDPPLYYQMLGNACPKPVNCAYGSNFFQLSDADLCGCCRCDGGAIGCSGGAQGRIICADGSYAQGCNCQYRVQ